MKTAEEWTIAELNGYDQEITKDNYIEINAIALKDLIKEIQLDAWKAGVQHSIERIKANPTAPNHWYESALINDLKDGETVVGG